jgi:tetratricopeptide (TPR) repeat protein
MIRRGSKVDPSWRRVRLFLIHRILKNHEMSTTDPSRRSEVVSRIGPAKEIPVDLRAAFNENPLDPRVWFNLGAMAHNDGDGPRAINDFRRAVLSEPTYVLAKARVMTSTARRSGPAAALAMARHVACVVPTSAQNRALITQYHFELGHDRRVGAAGRVSLVLDPGAAGLYRLMALSASRSQKMAMAAGLLQRALALQPGWTDARLALAGAWFALNDHEAAVRELELHDAGETGEGAMLRGRALLALERLDEADASFARAAVLEPDRQESINIVRQTMDRSLFLM